MKVRRWADLALEVWQSFFHMFIVKIIDWKVYSLRTCVYIQTANSIVTQIDWMSFAALNNMDTSAETLSEAVASEVYNIGSSA